MYIDNEKKRYRRARIAHWDKVAALKRRPGRAGAFYHKLLQRYYRFFIPPGLRVLELGCGQGDLLASLNPSFGVGVDFSGEMIRAATEKHPDLVFVQADAHDVWFQKKFDVIILSDLVNDLWDVQRILERIRNMCHSGTRLILNFYNNLWRIPLTVVRFLRLGAEVLAQNWFSPNDISNLLRLAGFEGVQRRAFILLPLKIAFLATLFNRYLVHLPPFHWLALTNIIIARPDPARDPLSDRHAPSVSIIVPARNEAGNIKTIIQRAPGLGSRTEIGRAHV